LCKNPEKEYPGLMIHLTIGHPREMAKQEEIREELAMTQFPTRLGWGAEMGGDNQGDAARAPSYWSLRSFAGGLWVRVFFHQLAIEKLDRGGEGHSEVGGGATIYLRDGGRVRGGGKRNNPQVKKRGWEKNVENFPQAKEREKRQVNVSLLGASRN